VTKYPITGIVYFIRAEESKRVKIGFTSTDPSARLATLQTGSPERLRLVAAVPGSMELERNLHEMLSASRIHGEWFRSTADVHALIVGVTISRPMTVEEMDALPRPLVVTSAELEEIANEVVSRRLHDEAHAAAAADVGAGCHPDSFWDEDFGLGVLAELAAVERPS
jgi:hypothetical protein